MHPEGFILGSSQWIDCGDSGAATIWSDQEGSWAPLFATQDMWECRELSTAGVPENSGEIEGWADGQTWWY